MDGVYCDMTASGVSMFGWWKMGDNQSDGKISIIGCNFRNGIETTAKTYLNFEGRNHKNNPSGYNATLNIQDNCFYNFQTNGKGFEVSLYAYNNISITGNLFLSSVPKTVDFIYFKDTTTVGKVNINLNQNRFVGVAGTVTNPANNSVLDISGSYHAGYSADFTNASSSKYLTGTNVTSVWYYTNYANNMRSDGLGGYSFGNGLVQNRQLRTLLISFGQGKTTFSINDFVLENNGNTIKVTGITDINKIPANTTKSYTVTVGNSSYYDTWTLYVAVNSTDMSALYSAINKGRGYLGLTGYRGYAMTVLSEQLAKGQALTLNAAADGTQVAAAASSITYTNDKLVALKSLDTQISKAQTQDTSTAEPLRVTIFKAALNDAKAKSDNTQSTLTQINTANSALSDAITGLSINSGDLGALIERAEQIMNSAEFEYYTRTTSAILISAYSAANNVYTNLNATAQQIAQAQSTLSSAIDGLAPNPVKLSAAIVNAAAITNTDKKYTKLSFLNT